MRPLAPLALAFLLAGCVQPSASLPTPIPVPALIPVPASVPNPVPAPTFDARSVDRAVTQAIARGEIPGAVVTVVDARGVLFTRAYGDKARDPAIEPMTEDTLFDLASLTKPLATAAAVLALVEDGKIDLHSPARRYLPTSPSADITVSDLLLHVSGLPADAPLGSDEGSREKNLAAALATSPTDPPRLGFRYSDLGYITLGAIVERVSGERLDVFVSRRFYEPLRMADTSFHPRDPARVAPTEKRRGLMLRGAVHDPRAARLEGVAGHAGLFATAGDLGRFVRMLLRGGELDGRRVLQEETVDKMLLPRAVSSGKRALGWDVDTGFSHPRGSVFGKNGFGHTGFTGTSIWVDRETGVGTIVLASRLHPGGGGEARRLRVEVANAVAHETLGDPRRGIDVIEDLDFAALRGRSLAVLTNDAARDSQGRRTLDVLATASGLDVRLVVSAEHGLAIDTEGAGSGARDRATHLPIAAAYGDSLATLSSRLDGIDSLVIDLPDVGARFFTYAATAAKAADIARGRGIRVIVLDRENPLGLAVEGPRPDVAGASLVAFFPVPVRHGLTLGGLLSLRGEVDVVGVEGGARDRTVAERGGAWLEPSPNLKTANGALLYPGVALLELTNVSVGRGTETPFELLGAPYVDAERLAEEVNAAGTPGIGVVPVHFLPTSGPYAGVRCGGVRLLVPDPRVVRPVRLGLVLARALLRVHPGEFHPENIRPLLAHEETYAALVRGESVASITRRWESDVIAIATNERQ